AGGRSRRRAREARRSRDAPPQDRRSARAPQGRGVRRIALRESGPAANSVLTLPLVGRVGAKRRGGGGAVMHERCPTAGPPPPTPPHKGEGGRPPAGRYRALLRRGGPRPAVPSRIFAFPPPAL